jgi:hypothetical protein
MRVRVIQKALALVTQKHSTWTRHELLKQLALVLPAQTRRMTPDAAHELLASLADQALSGQIEDVVCLEAPLWPPLPAALGRDLDHRSSYTRPGTARYATAAQLSAEELLVAHAQARGAPHLTPQQAAQQLGADAALLDAQLLGAFAASHALPWAVTALGPIPEDPAARQEWENKASTIGAYREMYGYHHPDDPIGPEPSHHSPGQRAAWHQAFTALRPTGGPDVRAMPDGKLWLIRDTYTTETRWAPRHVGRELRLARLGATNADLAAIREDAETDAARKDGDHQRTGRHERWAASYRAMSGRYRAQEETFAATMDDRRQWEQATAHSRRLAIAADAELRRRHPSQRIEPLRSAEPVPVSDTERRDLALAMDNKTGQLAQWVHDLAAQRMAFRAKLEERHAQPIPHEDRGRDGFGQAFPSPWAAGKDTVLKPPQPQITPSAKILHLTAEQDASPEAAS